MMELRPRVATAEMKERVARSIATDLATEGHIEPSDIDQSVADLAKVARPHMDGYEIAKALEDRCYWDCNLAIAEILDGFGSELDSEVRKAQKDWATSNNIQPPHPNGTPITIKGFRGSETGVIEGVYEHGAAQYLVIIDGDPAASGPAQSRRIVNFEDAEVRP